MTTVSYNEIEKIVYMPLPDGLADVWLHENIEETKDEDGNTCWTADEVYFRTAKDEEDIEENFETYFADGGTGEVIDPDDPGAPVTLTLAQRVEELEELAVELAEIAVDNGDLVLEDIPENLQETVRVKIDDSKRLDR